MHVTQIEYIKVKKDEFHCVKKNAVKVKHEKRKPKFMTITLGLLFNELTLRLIR